MECDLLAHQEQLNSWTGGIRSQGILWASNTQGSCWVPRNPNSLYSIDCAQTLPGKQLPTIGRNPNPPVFPVLLQCVTLTLNHSQNSPPPPNIKTARQLRSTKRIKPKGYWKDPAHRKDLLIRFAEDKGFEPLNAESWQSIKWKDLPKEVTKKRENLSVVYLNIPN